MSTDRKRINLLPEHQLVMCDWSVPVLGEVITMSEAAYMWNLSHGAVKNAVLTRRLDARRSFTGGDWLISLASMMTVYGSPKKDMLSCLKSE